MTYNFLNNPQARIGLNADKPGHYSFSTSLSNHIIDPGTAVELKIFITGYGAIDNCKIHVNFPDDIFDKDNSKLFLGMKYALENYDEAIDQGDLTISYGKEETSINDANLIIALENSGFVGENWHKKEITPFFDTSGGKTPVIATEHYSNKAPIQCSFSISQKAKPGTYNIYLVMTYYNGNEWKGDRIEIPLTITSIFQRNETLLAQLAIWLAIASTFFAFADALLNHFILQEILFNLLLPLAFFYIVLSLGSKKPILRIFDFKLR
jgi:hypothetical protein